MLSLLFSLSYCAKYAILFAGSKGWTNYRHQADVFYMYKILKDHGFDDDHISLWVYNDIVNNDLNPYKGKVFHTLDNTNIYPGDEKIDFKGEYLTGTNFIRYLKLLNTTQKDDIFIYYNDHGLANYLSCPVGNPMSSYQVQIFNTIELFRVSNFVVHSSQHQKKNLPAFPFFFYWTIAMSLAKIIYVDFGFWQNFWLLKVIDTVNIICEYHCLR